MADTGPWSLEERYGETCLSDHREELVVIKSIFFLMKPTEQRNMSQYEFSKIVQIWKSDDLQKFKNNSDRNFVFKNKLNSMKNYEIYEKRR